MYGETAAKTSEAEDDWHNWLEACRSSCGRRALTAHHRVQCKLKER